MQNSTLMIPIKIEIWLSRLRVRLSVKCSTRLQILLTVFETVIHDRITNTGTVIKQPDYESLESMGVDVLGNFEKF